MDLTDGCGRCRKEHFAFDRTVRLGPYDGLLRALILRMKRPNGDALAEAVAEEWAARVARDLTDQTPGVKIGRASCRERV